MTQTKRKGFSLYLRYVQIVLLLEKKTSPREKAVPLKMSGKKQPMRNKGRYMKFVPNFNTPACVHLLLPVFYMRNQLQRNIHIRPMWLPIPKI